MATDDCWGESFSFRVVATRRLPTLKQEALIVLRDIKRRKKHEGDGHMLGGVWEEPERGVQGDMIKIRSMYVTKVSKNKPKVYFLMFWILG